MKNFSDVCVGFVKSGMPVFSIFTDKSIIENTVFDETHHGLPVFTIDHAHLNKGQYILIGCGNTDMDYTTFDDITKGKRKCYSINTFDYTSHQMFVIASWLYDLKETTDFNFMVTANRIIVDNNEIYDTIKFLLANTIALAEETELSEYYKMEK